MTIDIVTALGLVFVIEGLLYALVPGQLKTVMAIVQQSSDDTLRKLGTAAAGIGVLIVMAARGFGVA